MAERPTLTIIGGPNGAGKSTLAERLITQGYALGRFINPDEIAKTLKGPEDVRAIAAGRETLRQTDDLIAKGESFTRETTLTSSEVIRTMRRAKAAGYMVNLIYVGANSVESTKRRVAGRVAEGGHDIPVEAQERRFERSLANASLAAREADAARFYDNAANGHELVAVAERGRLTAVSINAPAWLDRATEGLGRDGARGAFRVQDGAVEARVPGPRRRIDPADGFTGRILKIGEAPYRPEDPKSVLPYVDVEAGDGETRRLWGLGLPDMLDRYRLKEGDVAHFHSPGKETVTMWMPDGKADALIEKLVERRAWDAADIQRADRDGRGGADRSRRRDERDEGRGR